MITRTEAAVTEIAHLAADSGITFEITDVVDAVERGLPDNYPAPTTGTETRRTMIGDMAQRIISGELYEQ